MQTYVARGNYTTLQVTQTRAEVQRWWLRLQRVGTNSPYFSFKPGFLLPRFKREILLNRSSEGKAVFGADALPTLLWEDAHDGGDEVIRVERCVSALLFLLGT